MYPTTHDDGQRPMEIGHLTEVAVVSLDKWY